MTGFKGESQHEKPNTNSWHQLQIFRERERSNSIYVNGPENTISVCISVCTVRERLSISGVGVQVMRESIPFLQREIWQLACGWGAVRIAYGDHVGREIVLGERRRVEGETRGIYGLCSSRVIGFVPQSH